MANMIISKRGNFFCLNLLARQLSSFNNNRTKTGILSIIPNDDLNIWSESNWSQVGKQFNKYKYFPLPGQTGLSEFKTSEKDKSQKAISNKKEQKDQQVFIENINYLIYEPLQKEARVNSLLSILDKMEKNKDSPNMPKLELNTYDCPKTLLDDFQNYFRLNSIHPTTVITVSFQTENDMSTWNDKVDMERELMTEKFVDKARDICQLLEQHGYWADFIDPSSGNLHKSPYTHATFYETDERYRHFGFEIIDNGCCKVISHHKWGTKAYVGAIFTTANQSPRLTEFLQSEINN